MTSFFSYLLGIAHNWAARLVFLGIMLALWAYFVGNNLGGLQIYMLWFEQKTIFQVLNYNTVRALNDVLIFYITFKMYLWVAPHGTHPGQHFSSVQSGSTSYHV